ncbi:hypothetical protein AJ79_02804 [Helicocarpus griseus UAMH5409]|uniref:Aminoglycoside phosphotransferase domain-containing protein n=1 Tax=Helicocarpus griseus UAMH5409 TaxID=1447875 RepID=A0A2B7Y1V6_9EURO|nr:hypothetical protein AJ79_02804 [Helicocarpus griseus UAMH5409]
MHDMETSGDASETHYVEPNEPMAPTTSNDASKTKPRKALLDRFITLACAEDEEEDMRAELQYCQKRGILYTDLESKEEEIQSLVAAHCGLSNPSLIRIPKMVDPVNNKLVWLHGSFNVCIPVYINGDNNNSFAAGSLPAKMALRVPLPYKIGEEGFPGNAEEKVRSEAVTYIWIGKNCPDIPIPKLRGFGVTGGLSFFDPKSLSFWRKIKFRVRHLFWRLCRGSEISNYIPQKRTPLFNYNYLLRDWIEDENVEMLSKTFTMSHNTGSQIQNLYRARIPQPRIGSWAIDNDGYISLVNRPMLCHFHQLENLNIPTVPRDLTYSNADSFYLDILATHDNRLRHQGNAVFSEEDARAQAKDLVLMRASLHRYANRTLGDGPFVMQLTDMHDRNIFVDKEWSIKYLIDLEWACSLPLGDLLPPFWLGGKDGVDQIIGSDYERFKACYDRFVEIFGKEEVGTPPLQYGGDIYSRAATMKSALEDGRYWYLNALQTPKGLFNLFRTHIEPLHDSNVPKESVRNAVSAFWTPGVTSFVGQKLQDFAQYRQEVRDIFNSKKSGRAYL